MKRSLVLLLVLLLAVSALSACGNGGGGGGGGETPAAEGGHTEATFIETVEWKGTDTYQVSSSGNTVRFLVDSLITVDSDGNFCPNICESYSIAEDGSSISFVIPEDFKFADGTPLTPEDVKRSLEYGLETSPYNEDYANISEIEIDGQTVICKLSNWNPATLYSFSRNMVPILPAAQIDSMSPDELLWAATPYGAYYLDEYVEGSHVTLKANPYYKTNNPGCENKGPATVETLTLRFITDPFAIANTLAGDEAIGVYAVDPSGLNDIESKNDKMKVIELQLNRVYWLMVNESKEPFADDNVRKAIALAIDRDGICGHDDILAEPAWIYNSRKSIDFAKEASDYNEANYSYNKEEAVRLLEEAGWKDTDGDGILDKDGQKFSVKIGMVTPNALPTLLQIQLQEVGIEVEIVSGEDVTTQRSDDTYDMIVQGYGWGDVAGTLPYILIDSNNPSVDADAYLGTVAEGIQNTEAEPRIKKFAEAQEMLIDSFTMIPLVSQSGLMIYNTEYMDDDIFFAATYIKPNELK